MIKRAPRRDEPVPISVARGQLFELVEEVLDGRVDRIALSHRGRAERVVLVRADVLARLEAELAALRARVGPEPRPLRGLATINAPVEDVLAEVRGRQDALAAAKRQDLFGSAGGGAGSGTPDTR